MSEPSPSSVAADAAQDSRPALTPDAIEGVLQDFRAWLQEALQRQPEDDAGTADDSGFSWQTLVAEFTALRHEVNLQTRAARAQSEQNAAAVTQLEEALAALDAARQAGASLADDALRPLLKTIIDVYDALALARREVARVQAAVEASLKRLETHPDAMPETVRAARPVLVRQRPWWHRWSSVVKGPDANTHNLQNRVAELESLLARQQQLIEQWRGERAVGWQAGEQVRQFLTSVITGYTMSLQRLDRALAAHDLQVIQSLGEPFDPECMEVVEVVAEPGRVGTEVLEEVRRGYLWRGRLFRHAQVRVARP
jgi:molecular chaperone GrpE